MDATNETADRDALQRALSACRAESPERSQQLDPRLANEPWSTVAGFAATCEQGRALDLSPWQQVPCRANLTRALSRPFGQPRGEREAGEILQRMLALGLSRLEPDPLRAITEAKKTRVNYN